MGQEEQEAGSLIHKSDEDESPHHFFLWVLKSDHHPRCRVGGGVGVVGWVAISYTTPSHPLVNRLTIRLFLFFKTFGIDPHSLIVTTHPFIFPMFIFWTSIV